jgi:two-component system, response regulator PdtaR
MPSSDESRPVVILIADDELLVRMSVADILQDAGYHVVEARDGVEALAILELRNDVSVLFTDVQMTSMHGITLARIVSERWPHIGIVVASGALPPGVPLQLPEGARFIRKPYNAEALLREIAAVAPLASATPVALQSIPTIQPGRIHGAGGIAQPLPEPEE